MPRLCLNIIVWMFGSRRSHLSHKKEDQLVAESVSFRLCSWMELQMGTYINFSLDSVLIIRRILAISYFLCIFFYRKRLKNIQSFKTHVQSSLAIKSLVLPSRRRSGLETLSKPRRRRKRGRSKTKNIMSRTIAMECRVRETEAYGGERIMSVAVNHAVSSN